MMDELLNPVDTECEEIRRLMLEDDERELSGFEARRIEQHVTACPGCFGVLEGRDGLAGQQDRVVRSLSLDQPSAEEWDSMKGRIWAELDLGSPPVAESTPAPSREPSPASTPALASNTPNWRVWGALAAGLALVWVLTSLREAPTSPTEDPAEDVIAAEVLELGDDQDYIILNADEEDGVLILMTTSG